MPNDPKEQIVDWSKVTTSQEKISSSEMKNSSDFFCNKECEWFPCHSCYNYDNFNCLFCFCPLYYYKDCGGNYIILDNGWKDCSNCFIPHQNYQYIIEKLKKLYKGL